MSRPEPALIKEKIRHHYVPRSYLKHWMRAEGKEKPRLWAWNKERMEIRPVTDTYEVGQKRRFYRIELDDATYSLILIKYQRVIGSPLIEGILASLKVMNQVHRYISAELEHHQNLQVLNTNFLEDQYGRLEDGFATLLEAVNQPDGSFLQLLKKNQSLYYQQFIALAVTQALRTRTARTQVKAMVADLILRTDGHEETLTPEQNDTFLKITLFIDSLLLAERINQNRPTIWLYTNDSEAGFLTSNSPVAIHLPEGAAVDCVKGIRMQMPLGPRVAMEIHCDGQSDISLIDLPHAMVSGLNRSVFERSTDDIYATSRSQLEESVSTYGEANRLRR